MESENLLQKRQPCKTDGDYYRVFHYENHGEPPSHWLEGAIKNFWFLRLEPLYGGRGEPQEERFRDKEPPVHKNTNFNI